MFSKRITLAFFAALILCGCQTTLKSHMNKLGEKDYHTQSAKIPKICQQGVEFACYLNGKSFPNYSYRRLSVLQGPGTETTAQFNFLVPPMERELKIYIHPKNQPLIGFWVTKITTENVANSDYDIQHFFIEHLQPKIDYKMLFVNSSGEIVDQRQFQTSELSKKFANLLTVSGLREELYTQQQQYWSVVKKFNIDAIFLIGNVVMADELHYQPQKHANKNLLWQRYLESRLRLPLYYMENLIPVVANWNEHDYGKVNGDQNYKHRLLARRVFKTFFPQKAINIAFIEGPGNSYLWNGFSQQFFFMDNRTFRTKNNKYTKFQYQWGREQLRFLQDNIKTSSLIINGGPVFLNYRPSESFLRNQPYGLKNAMQTLRSTNKKFAFITGGNSLTEVARVPKVWLGYDSIELNVSGLIEQLEKDYWQRYPNDLQLAGIVGQHHFLLVQSKAEENNIRLHVVAKDLNENKLMNQIFNAPYPPQNKPLQGPRRALSNTPELSN